MKSRIILAPNPAANSRRPIARAHVPAGRYLRRPSQITRRSPTKRLQGRRRVNLAGGKEGFFPNPGVRIVHNKLLGGWYIVRGPHQTPISGRFPSKEAAQQSLIDAKNRRDNFTQNPGKRISHKGIYYFPSYEDAREYASRFGFPQNRIIRYERGWAIQLRVSGPYVGSQTKPYVKGGVIVDADYYNNPTRTARTLVSLTGQHSGKIYGFVEEKDLRSGETRLAAKRLANAHREPIQFERVNVVTLSPRMKSNPAPSMEKIKRDALLSDLRKAYEKHSRKYLGKGSAWPFQVYVPAQGIFYIHEDGGVSADGMGKKLIADLRPAFDERFRKNPAPDAIAAAARRFTRFTGHAADRVQNVPFPGNPGAGLAVGPVLMIGYNAMRDGKAENYVHKFAAHARPMLVSSHDGTQLFLLGGRYKFTERGIVDATSRPSRT